MREMTSCADLQMKLSLSGNTSDLRVKNDMQSLKLLETLVDHCTERVICFVDASHLCHLCQHTELNRIYPSIISTGSGWADFCHH